MKLTCPAVLIIVLAASPSVFAAPDFSLSVSPASLSAAQGTTARFIVTTTPSGGFKGTGGVILTMSGLPTASSFSPNACNSNGPAAIDISIGLTSPTGTYPITFTCTNGSLVRSVNATLVVTTAPPYFTLSAAPSARLATVGGTATFNISISAFNGFTGVVMLSVTGAPANVSGTFSPSSINGAGSSTLTLQAAANALPGVYDLVVNAINGSSTKTANIKLHLNGVGADFTLSSNPTTAAEVITFNCATTVYEISVAGVNGFSETVTLSVPNPPANLSVSWNPGSSSTALVTGSGSAQLNLCSYTYGTKSVTISGSGSV